MSIVRVGRMGGRSRRIDRGALEAFWRAVFGGGEVGLCRICIGLAQLVLGLVSCLSGNIVGNRFDYRRSISFKASFEPLESFPVGH